MQRANSFDRETMLKIGKSFLYACLSGVSAGITCYVQTRDMEVAILTGIATLTSFLVNIHIEYRKGE